MTKIARLGTIFFAATAVLAFAGCSEQKSEKKSEPAPSAAPDQTEKNGMGGGSDKKPADTTSNDTSQPTVSEPESDCLAAVANQVGNGDVSTISVKQGENQIKVEVRVPGAQAPWICEHDSTKVTKVYFGGEG